MKPYSFSNKFGSETLKYFFRQKYSFVGYESASIETSMLYELIEKEEKNSFTAFKFILIEYILDKG